MIRLEHISFTYNNSREQVLKDFNLTIKDGEFLCVIGHSGCGKSTLIRLLAGLESAENGSLNIKSANGVDELRKAVVFQQYSLFPWMTVWKNIYFATMKTRRFSKEEAKDRTGYFLKKAGMEESKDKYPFQLSGGMRQRTAIARALAMDAELLLLDEPFGALDVQNRKELQNLLHKLWEEQKKTVVFVTHDLDEALCLGSRIVFLKNGTITKEVEINKRIHCCCVEESGFSDCKSLRESLEEWYRE